MNPLAPMGISPAPPGAGRFATVLMLGIALSVIAATPTWGRWQTWRPGQGPLGAGASCMIEDRSGACWIGTAVGVSRYDGLTWKNFTVADGLVNNVINSMIEDRHGTIWVGTPSGVGQYDGTTWRRFDALGTAYVNCILEDRSGALWFGTYGQGAYRFDGENWLHFDLQYSEGVVSALLQDRSGDIWLASWYGGAYRYDGDTFQPLDGLPAIRLSCIAQDSTGAIWFGTDQGAVRYDGSSFRSFTASDGLIENWVNSILVDRTGAVWLGSVGDTAGVARYDGVRMRRFTTADGLPQGGGLLCRLQDRSGGLWFSNYSGLSRYDGESWRTFTTADGLANNSVNDIFKDRSGALWFATGALAFGYGGGGVTRYDGESWRNFTTADSLASDLVTCILEDRQGAMWFGTSGGVSRYDSTGWRTFTTADGLAHNSVRCMLEDRSGAMWFGTYSGLSRYDSTGWHTYTAADGPPPWAVNAILQDRTGALWVATMGGLYRYDTTWQRFTTVDGLANDIVDCIYEDRGGALWFGTGVDNDGGLSRYDGTSWHAFTANEGFTISGVNRIFQDRHGTLWFGTGGGVARYDDVGWNVLTPLDGLTRGTVTAINEDDRGMLWFGTSGLAPGDAGGASAFTPDDVPPRTLFLTRPPEVSSDPRPSISYLAAFGDQSIQFQWSMDGGLWSAWSPSNVWPSSTLIDGRHEIRVHGRDASNNVESPPGMLRFEIDATPPSPAVRSPAPDAALRDSVGIRGTSADARFDWYRLEYRTRGAGAWTALTDTVRHPVTDGVLGGWNTRGLADGDYELRLSVADTLGLVGRVVVPVSVDNQFPFAPQTAPALVTAATGGNVYTVDAKAHLYVPPQGLTEDAVVRITAMPDTGGPVPSGAVSLGLGYDVSWGGVALEKPATLEISLEGLALGVGTPALYVAIDSTSWRRLGGTVDAKAQRIALSTTTPGRFALFEDSGGPRGPRTLGGLSFTPRVFSASGGFGSREVGIGFTLGRAGPVTVKVYSPNGRLIRDVADGATMAAGSNLVRWDGRDREGSVVRDGLYLVTVEALGETEKKTLAVVR